MANKVIANYSYDKRRQSFGAVDDKGHFVAAQKMYRGRIETVPTASFGPQKTIYQFYFMYNPVTLSHSSAVDPGYSPANMYEENTGAFPADPSPFLSLSQTISWQILVDRTYETWHQDGSYLSEWGVLADVKVLYAMLGLYSTFSGVSHDDGWHDDGKAPNPHTITQLTPNSTHLFRPAWAVFGPRLKYYGAINQFQIDYTHFTQRMIPNRMTVQFSMQLIPKSPGSRQSYIKDQFKQAGKSAGTPSGHVNAGLFDG